MTLPKILKDYDTSQNVPKMVSKSSQNCVSKLFWEDRKKFMAHIIAIFIGFWKGEKSRSNFDTILGRLPKISRDYGKCQNP